MRTPSFLLTALAASTSFLQTRATTFSKTVGFAYQTHTTAVPSCGTAIHSAGFRCPSGCALDKLNYGHVATTAYECKPTAAATSVVAAPIIAFMSCDLSEYQFTTTVTPAYGAKWTTCATASEGATHYASAVTLSLVTEAP